MKKNFSFFLLAFIIAIFSAGLIAFPRETAKTVRDALSVCANSVIPSLFPFFVVSRLITGLGYADFFARALTRIMKPFFGTGGASAPALILGLTGGYPIGASTCASLYKSHICTKVEAERLLAFCNNSGPAFIIGAVGIGIYSSIKIGFMLFIIHAISALTVGVLFRLFSPINCNSSVERINIKEKPPFYSVFTDSISQSLFSCLSICAYIVLFSVMVAILNKFCIFTFLAYIPAKLFKTDKSVISAFLSGIFEITNGTFSLASNASPRVSFILTAFLLGWGGFSVHFQTLGIIEDCGLDTSQYFPGKIYHGIISAIYAFFLSPLLHEKTALVSSIIKYQKHDSYIFLLMFILTIVIIAEFCKKGWKTERK